MRRKRRRKKLTYRPVSSTPGKKKLNFIPARAKMAYTVAEDVLYVAGGIDSSNAITDKFESFDGSSWTSLKSLPAATQG